MLVQACKNRLFRCRQYCNTTGEALLRLVSLGGVALVLHASLRSAAPGRRAAARFAQQRPLASHHPAALRAAPRLASLGSAMPRYAQRRASLRAAPRAAARLASLGSGRGASSEAQSSRREGPMPSADALGLRHKPAMEPAMAPAAARAAAASAAKGEGGGAGSSGRAAAGGGGGGGGGGKSGCEGGRLREAEAAAVSAATRAADAARRSTPAADALVRAALDVVKFFAPPSTSIKSGCTG